MATGGPEDTLETDVSAVSGSEAVFDHVCQPCIDYEHIKEAVRFCENCSEWLCDGCVRVHTIPRPMRHHVLRDKEAMKNSIPTPKPTDKCTETCDQHRGKRLTYYCPVHDFLGCSLCVIQDHKSCDVDHIPDVCKSSDIQDEFEHVTAKLGTVAKESNDIVMEVEKNYPMIKTMKTRAVDNFRSYTQTLKRSLDEVGDTLEETCEKKANVETEKMKTVVEKCKNIGKESLVMKTRLEKSRGTGHHCDVFVALKRSLRKLATLESTQKYAKLLSAITTYTFKPNMSVEATITGPDGIGSLMEHHYGKDKDYSIVQTRHAGDINIKTTGNKTCVITGSTLLSPNTLVVADYYNKQVKVIDTNAHEVTSEYKVDGTPWCVCKTSDNSVAVTIQDKQKLLFLSIDAEGIISKEKSIPVNGKCKGVTMLENGILITYTEPVKAEIMDTSGSVLHQITDPKITQFPQYVAVSPDKRSMYISNSGNSTVTCMRPDGTLISTYKDSELREPEQIVIDSNGMIFVSARRSKNVHLVTPDCKKVKVILDESDGIGKAFALSYCEQTHRLYVGMYQCDVIKVFQLI